MRTVIDKFDIHLIQKALGLEPKGQRYRRDVVVCIRDSVSLWKGQSHTEDTKRLLSELKMGSIPWNKGITNLIQRDKFLRNNPMKNPDIAKKVSAMTRGRPSPQKITKTYIKKCKECGSEEEKRDTKHNRINVFCREDSWIKVELLTGPVSGGYFKKGSGVDDSYFTDSRGRKISMGTVRGWEYEYDEKR